MFKLLLPLAMILVLTTACDTLAQTDETGYGSGSQQISVDETTGATRRTGACDGLDTINKVVAAQEANPMRAMRTYDTKSMRGCLSGRVVGFQTLSGGIYSNMDKDDPRRLSIQVLIEEGRGFSISQSSVQLSAEPPGNADWPGWEETPEGLTDDEYKEWNDKQQAKYEILWAEYEKAKDAELERWDDFALSVSKGDTVRAECNLFGRVPNTHQFRDRNLFAFEPDVWLHVGCHWIDD